MDGVGTETRPTAVPLWTFGFLCLFTFLLSHVRLTVTTNTDPEVFPSCNPHRNWTIWNYDQASECGLFLKAVIMVSSPFLPLTSTLFLLVGVLRKNTYLFLPWLVLTFKGLLTVQSLNLYEVYHILRKWSGCGEWRYFCIYLVIFVFETAGCLCYREVFRIFRKLWAIDASPLTEHSQVDKIQQEENSSDFSEERDG